jgi:putative transposase
MSRAERRALVERTAPPLPVSQQCRLLAVSRSSVYRRPAEVSEEDLAIMVLIDRHYLARPYYGSRRMAAWLATQGHVVNRKRVQRLMRLMGLVTKHQQSGSGAQGLPVSAWWDRDRAGQSGVVLGHHLHPDGQRLSLSGSDHGLGEPCGAGVATVEHVGTEFCVDALEEALSEHDRPEIFNTDQGSQFTSDGFTGSLEAHDVTISMDGKGRYMDNIFVERLWRSLKYEEVYLHAYATVAEAKAGIGAWISFYNDERQHQSLGYRTPRRVYEEGLWICGRSASPTGCASPASRASSESGEMLAFAHIPTGTTASKGIDIDDSESRLVAPAVAVTAIGADIKIGRATP